tara:strand:- start:1416 stop:2177 length:762 start_codon:yes stop_codon:yes gene_type:complete
MAKQMPKHLEGYVMVEDRLPLFYKRFEDGRITTEVIAHTSDSIITKSSIFADADQQERGIPLATGICKEVFTSQMPKYVEVSETSSIGRALANYGIRGLDSEGNEAKRPSLEEMQSVQAQQEDAANYNDIEEHSLLEEVLAQPETELVSQVQGSAIPIHKDGNPMYVVSDFRGEMQPRCAKHMGKGDYASEPARMWPVEWDPHQKEGNDNWKIQKVGASESIYKCTAQDSSEPEKYCLRFVTQAGFKAKHVAF